jgi:hypothetical protein
LRKLGLELGNLGGEYIAVCYSSIPVKGEVFDFGGKGYELIGEVLAGIEGIREVNYSFIARSRVAGLKELVEVVAKALIA